MPNRDELWERAQWLEASLYCEDFVVDTSDAFDVIRAADWSERHQAVVLEVAELAGWDPHELRAALLEHPADDDGGAPCGRLTVWGAALLCERRQQLPN